MISFMKNILKFNFSSNVSRTKPLRGPTGGTLNISRSDMPY